jgi:uncharacterized membrane protein
MMNEPLANGPVIAILVMAAATFMTRVSGYWLMGHIPLTKRVRRVLQILPGAIMAATVVPIIAKVGVAALIAVVVALASMMIRRNEFIAVGLALIAASVARAAGL